MNFKTPENKGSGKLSSLCDLVIKGDNIATTHVLFSVLTSEIVDQIIKMQYVLVIDEAENASPINIWLGGTTYTRGDCVIYGSCLYRCKTDHTATTFDKDYSK